MAQIEWAEAQARHEALRSPLAEVAAAPSDTAEAHNWSPFALDTIFMEEVRRDE